MTNIEQIGEVVDDVAKLDHFTLEDGHEYAEEQPLHEGVLRPQLDQLKIVFFLVLRQKKEQTVRNQVQLVEASDRFYRVEEAAHLYPELVFTTTPVVDKVLRVVDSETR